MRAVAAALAGSSTPITVIYDSSKGACSGINAPAAAGRSIAKLRSIFGAPSAAARGSRLGACLRLIELDDVCGDGLCGIDETRQSCSEDCTDPLPPGCAGAERYVAFDPESRTIVSRREAITISWYSNAGKYANERTGTAESDTANLSSNVWTAPGSGESTLWVVIRDSRGGVGFQEYRVQVGGP